MKELKIHSLQQLDFSELKFPIVTIYNQPADHPEEVIARVWEAAVEPPAPTNTYASYQTITQAEADIRAVGFTTCLPRDKTDYACIVASYIK